MATARQNNGPHITRKAGADLSAKQFRFVKMSSGNVVAGAAATDKVVGVLQNKPTSGDTAEIRLIANGGTYKVVAGGAITEGAYITCDSNGEAIATTTAGNVVLGRALEAADDGDLFEVVPAYFHHKS